MYRRQVLVWNASVYPARFPSTESLLLRIFPCFPKRRTPDHKRNPSSNKKAKLNQLDLHFSLVEQIPCIPVPSQENGRRQQKAVLSLVKRPKSQLNNLLGVHDFLDYIRWFSASVSLFYLYFILVFIIHISVSA